MTLPLQSRRISLAEAERLVPRLCERLSLSRSMIARDQLRAMQEQGSEDRVVAVTVGTFAPGSPPLAAAIAILSPSSASGTDRSDSATMVLAGLIGRSAHEACEQNLAVQIASALDQRLQQLGVRFIQWPTDDIANQTMSGSVAWSRGLGFEPIATLDYLAGPIDGGDAFTPQDLSAPLHVKAIQWGSEADLRDFTDLIAQTYQGTRDCPKLNHFRSVHQTLQAYQSAAAFTPSWWFRLLDPRELQVVGCLILARHRCQDASTARRDVVEIVYMGLTPQHRGKKLGSQMIQLAKDLGERTDCDHLIAAVDRANTPAKLLYERAGMHRWMGETVWVKSLDDATHVGRFSW